MKADPDSDAMMRLDKAGGAVKKASDDLINAAKDAREAKVDVQVIKYWIIHGSLILKPRLEIKIIESEILCQQERLVCEFSLTWVSKAGAICFSGSANERAWESGRALPVVRSGAKSPSLSRAPPWPINTREELNFLSLGQSQSLN